jgi:transcriptional regulator with AAA-type ATPase domain
LTCSQNTLQPKYLFVDEIEHLKPEYQTTLMENGILTQMMHSKVRHMHLKHGSSQQVTVQRNFQKPCLADLGLRI